MTADRVSLGDSSGPTLPIVKSVTRVQDIDNEDDWIIAEMKFRLSAGAIEPAAVGFDKGEHEA